MKLSSTMTAVFFAWFIIFVGPATYASCGSETTECWDSCEGAWVPVAGNTCSSKSAHSDSTPEKSQTKLRYDF